jgi:sialidase-1
MIRRRTILSLGAGLLVSGAEPSIRHYPLFVSGFAGGRSTYHTYRIPSILRTGKGTLLAFCEGRKNSTGDTGDIDIVFRRSTDGGRTWSESVAIHDLREDVIGNPCPVFDRKTGAIHLLLTSNAGNITENQMIAGSAPTNRRVWSSTSIDDGRTWSKLRDITAQTKRDEWVWYATGPGIGIQLRSGRLLVPCDHIVGGTRAYHSHVIYSDDGGKTWSIGGIAGEKTNESQAVELEDGSVLLNMRSVAGRNRRAIARSTDGGKSFGPVEFDEALVEPVCQASLLRIKNLVLFSNPASTRRENLTVRASRDGGKTWPHKLQLHAGMSAYSCLTHMEGDRIACLYERGEKSPYEQIVLAEFRLKDLLAN